MSATIGRSIPRVALVAALAAAAPAGAQSLGERVAAAGDATVRLRYGVRAGVCGDGAHGITIRSADGTSTYGHHARHSRDDGGWDTARCEPGPARVVLTVRGGVPRALRLAVGSDWPAGEADVPARVVDLGAVPAPAAADYLLDLAARGDAPSPSRVLLAAVVADSSETWPRLLRLARDERLPHATRREAAHWAGRAACDAVTAARGSVTAADTADREVRRQVVFALSQGRTDERRSALVRVARADRDPAVRCAAIFWLGQQDGRAGPDARTLDLYEAALRGR